MLLCGIWPKPRIQGQPFAAETGPAVKGLKTIKKEVCNDDQRDRTRLQCRKILKTMFR